MLFSQRKGLKPKKVAMQLDSMDDDLRASLWNALSIFYWEDFRTESYRSPNMHSEL